MVGPTPYKPKAHTLMRLAVQALVAAFAEGARVVCAGDLEGRNVGVDLGDVEVAVSEAVELCGLGGDGGERAGRGYFQAGLDEGGEEEERGGNECELHDDCLLYTSPSPRDGLLSRMPSSA